jgi:hypothetical protein
VIDQAHFELPDRDLMLIADTFDVSEATIKLGLSKPAAEGQPVSSRASAIRGRRDVSGWRSKRTAATRGV